MHHDMLGRERFLCLVKGLFTIFRNSWFFSRSWLSGWRIELRLRMLIIPRKALSWVEFSGHGAFLMASIFSSFGEIPSADLTQPIKVTNCGINSLLLGWSCKPELFRQRRTEFKFWMCCSSFCPMMVYTIDTAYACNDGKWALITSNSFLKYTVSKNGPRQLAFGILSGKWRLSESPPSTKTCRERPDR